MASIFSRIVSGEIPCYKVAESEFCIAFLDVNPLAKGHVLVVPKKEIDYIFDIDDELYEELFVFSKKIAKAIQKIVPCTKVGMSIIGLEVPHAHIHLVPINNISDLNFSGPRVSLKTSEFIELANQIQDVLN